VTSPLTPNEQNAKSRSSTSGIRPDLYEALQTWMVKRKEMDELDPLKDFGSVYAHGSGGLYGDDVFTGSAYMPFDRKIGDMRGCHIHPDGGIIFDDIGMWTADAHVTASDLITAPGVGNMLYVEVRFFSPDGELISALRNTQSTTSFTSMTAKASITVDQPGSYVRVHCRSNSVGNVRGWKGGEGHTRLTVQHINRVTSAGVNSRGETDNG
jgi:hypothetical protein